MDQGVTLTLIHSHFCRTRVSGPHLPANTCPTHTQFRSTPYEYRRDLPHYQKADCVLFVTFCKLIKDPLPDAARSIVLQHCLHDHGSKLRMHVAVVMPEHVHLLLTPLRDGQGWPYPLHKLLKLIKGTSARSVNKLLASDPRCARQAGKELRRKGERLR